MILRAQEAFLTRCKTQATLVTTIAYLRYVLSLVRPIAGTIGTRAWCRRAISIDGLQMGYS